MRYTSLLLIIAGAPVMAADFAFTGYARSLDTSELLYVELHAVSAAGTPRESRVVLYGCADGQAPFARKELVYATRIAPTFRFEDARSGYAEGLSRDARGLQVSARAGTAAELRTARVDDRGLIADAGFDEFVRARWDELERGKSLEAPFLVPSRLESMKFRVRKVGETKIGEDTASVIRLSLAGLLGWVLPDIDVSYRHRDRQLLRYRGTTNVRDANGKLIVAEIDFPDEGRSEGAVDLEKWRALPLVSACR